MNDLQNIIPRIQIPRLKKVLHDHPVVILHGARQTGKTTLAQIPIIGKNRSYVSLDDFDVMDTAGRDPSALFIGHRKTTLDEVQRKPEILLAIKADVDRNREAGRFLLTGSANLLLMKRVSETLAGRAVYCFLPPFTWAESEGQRFGGLLDELLEQSSVEDAIKHLSMKTPHPSRKMSSAISAGGYPVPTLSNDVSFRSAWFDGYIQTYLERDLRDFSATDNLVEFRRLMQICAVQNGRLLNIASLANDAGLSPATARRYLNILGASFQIITIPAYAVNKGKRLTKAPKMFWNDTGLAAHLAGIFDEKSLVQSREWGAWIENWVGTHLLVYTSLRSPRPTLFHWRTSSGHEVDFVLEFGKKLLPIEVKATSRPTGGDIQGLEVFMDTYSNAPLGIVVCQCNEPTVLSSRILALPFESLLLT